MWSLADELVELDKLYTSDIYAILQTYGVEACRTAIINEMAAVFGVYGIKVDYRHRTVIADYMVCPPFSTPPSFSSSTFLSSFLAYSSTALCSAPSLLQPSKNRQLTNRPTQEHTEHSTEQTLATNPLPYSKHHSKQQPNS
jgi:hypothetical protein